ncbi:MAG: hypothetical protein LBQ14_07255 [Treponema sp.]|jgi:hypothetical protein|nr:hypothetical protein [Treponema sp.]
MRRIGDHLDRFFKCPAVYLIDHKGQHNSCRETHRQLVHADRQGVFKNIPKFGVTPKTQEIFHSHPPAADNAADRAEILKSYLDAVHGAVIENDDINKGGEKEQINLPVSSENCRLCGHPL